MKHFALCLSLVSFMFSNAQESSVANIQLKKATVYLSNAQLEHQGALNLKAGANFFVVKNLSPFIDPNSISASADNGAVISAIQLKPVFAENSGLPEHFLKLKNQLKEAELSLSIRRSYKQVYLEEKDLLLKNKTVLGSDSKLTPDDLNDLANIYRTRLKEIEVKIIEIGEEEKKWAEDVQRLQAMLGDHQNALVDRRCELEMTVYAKNPGIAQLKLQYLTSNAGWMPAYDIKTADAMSGMQLVSKAMVFQNTGVDWKDVKLSLSTGNPAVAGQQPQLYPDYVDYRLSTPAPMYKNLRKEAVSASMQGNRDAEDALMPQVQMSQGLISVQYDISVPYSVNSSARSTEVEINQQNMEADFHYLAIPKLQREVHLIAAVKNADKLNLVPGPASIYFNDAFVGKSYINPEAAAVMDISLGTDNGVLAQRIDLNQFSKDAGWVGGNKKSFHYKLSVKNNKNKAIVLDLQDQMPVSKNADIIVEPENISGAEWNNQSGVLTWKLNLQPGEQKELELKYFIKYPKGSQINR